MNSLPALLGSEPTFDNKIPLVRPILPNPQLFAEEIRSIFESGVLTKGARLRRFEERIAEYLGVKHAIGVASCTTGLMLAYRALDLTGEVIVPSFTFMATVSALVWNNLKPAFVDVDAGTTNIDPAAVAAAINSNTAAVVAVHNFGNPADIEALERITDRHGIPLIFDAAHAFGALNKGRPVGAQGRVQVFSMSATKILVAGEGGVVATNDDTIAERLRISREYGNDGHYDSLFIGLNGRLMEINAALAQEGLPHLESAARHRNAMVAVYRARLEHLPGLVFQEVRAGNRSSYTSLAVCISAEDFGLSRDELAVALAAENIETRTYYWPPIHHQTAYRRFVAEDLALPNTDLLSSTVLCLPMWSNIEESIVENICKAIQRLHAFAPEIRARLTTNNLVAV